MALDRQQIARLVAGLNATSNDEAKRAESELSALLFSFVRLLPGSRGIIGSEEYCSRRDAHFAEVHTSDAILPLIEAIRTGTDFARAIACRFLGLLKDPRATPLIIGALEDPSPNVRSNAAHGLAATKAPAAISPLLRCLDDADTEAACSAATTLGRMKATEATASLVLMAKHKDWRRRQYAYWALSDIGDSSTLPIVRSGLTDKHNRGRQVRVSTF